MTGRIVAEDWARTPRDKPSEMVDSTRVDDRRRIVYGALAAVHRSGLCASCA
jgi:hypothetical protein